MSPPEPLPPVFATLSWAPPPPPVAEIVGLVHAVELVPKQLVLPVPPLPPPNPPPPPPPPAPHTSTSIYEMLEGGVYAMPSEVVDAESVTMRVKVTPEPDEVSVAVV